MVDEALEEALTWALDTLDAEAYGHYIDHKAKYRALLARDKALGSCPRCGHKTDDHDAEEGWCDDCEVCAPHALGLVNRVTVNALRREEHMPPDWAWNEALDAVLALLSAGDKAEAPR